MGKCKIMLKRMMIAGLMGATVLGGIAPAYAQRGDESAWRVRDRGDGGGRGERGNGGDRGQREQRGGGDARQGASRPSEGGRWQQRTVERAAAQPVQQQRVEQRWRGDRDGDRNDRPQWREERRTQQAPAWRVDGRTDGRRDNDRNWRDNDRRDGDRNWRDNDRDRDRRDWNNDDRRWRGGYDGRRYDDRTRWSNQRRWDNRWRNDRRYDWYSYRSRYGDRYRMGRYYAPRGWSYGYTRFSVGILLNSLLFSNSYWINDPGYYRLPPAYGTLRWVRYYDDALLVDIRDGYVVDVIHGFFW
jgi:hypothetical protein